MHGSIPCRFVGALAFFVVSPAAHAVANPIPNFREVEPGLYRGGAPGTEGVAYLKALGVKTIVTLDDRQPENLAEANASAAVGIREVTAPLSGFWWPTENRVNRALEALEDPALRPIFVHCQHGQDRTGLVVGLYRVEANRWQPAHAYEEMKELGFHPILFLLNHYFEERTGFED